MSKTGLLAMGRSMMNIVLILLVGGIIGVGADRGEVVITVRRGTRKGL